MFEISTVSPSDAAGREAVRTLLQREGIRLDTHLDYTCAIYDERRAAIATGSCYANTLRCFAVDHAHRGKGLMHRILTHLMEVQKQRGHTGVFLYTKVSTAFFFQKLGFHEIARVPDSIVFLENQAAGFPSYLKKLQDETPRGYAPPISALVLNANPFTLGHQYLVEYAARESTLLHIFIVSEDISFFPFAVRERLVRAGTAHLKNVTYHASGPYIVSQATFPSYFQKDEDAAILGHARLDIAVFQRIAAALGITRRYVGSEPSSHVTNLYNETMTQFLPETNIECRIIPRKEAEGAPISASTVRRYIQEGNLAALASLVPPSTLAFLQSDESAEIRRKIIQTADVVHY